jgi:hypothetical protein
MGWGGEAGHSAREGRNVSLNIRPYLDQARDWPAAGRHILAQFDDDAIVVYQAYRPAIAAYAVRHQRFGGEFSFTRMSWIKPNFLWMMFRSGWATKPGQEHVLAMRLRRAFFDELLAAAVSSTFDPRRFATESAWKAALAASQVRLQWDPDHGPAGGPVERRAVQLGLRGATLRRYAEAEILSIEDVTPFVAAQRENAANALGQLVTPEERVYVPSTREAMLGAGIDELPSA